MKKIILAATISAIILSCSTEKTEKPIMKNWLGRKVDFKQIKPVINTYHMFDSTETKVGSMVFGTYFENGMLVSRDTSQFDNGSVYEEAQFILDTSDFILKSVNIDMSFGPTSLLVDVNKDMNKIKGVYQVSRDTVVNRTPIDSAFRYDVFRSELYMLMHAINYKNEDTLSFTALAPTSMRLSNASIYYEGEETIEVPAGTFDCEVIWLRTDGAMPTNKIWISKGEERKLIKFYVPGSELDLELASSYLPRE